MATAHKAHGKIALAATLFAAGLLTAACGGGSSGGGSGSGSANNSSPIKIGFVGTLSGAESAPSVQEEDSLKAWVNQTNKSGGILGRQVKVTYVDDQFSAAKATQAVRQLTSDGNHIILGPIMEPTAVQPLEAQHSFVQFILFPITDLGNPSKFPNTFNLYPQSTQDGVVQIAQYTTSHAQKKWAIVADTVPANQHFSDELQTAAQTVGASVVLRQSFDPSTLDFSAIVSKIKSSGANAVMITSVGAPVGAFMQAMGTAGLNLPIYGNATIAFSDLSAVPQKILNNTYVVLARSSVLSNGAPLTGYQELTKAVYAMVGKKNINGSGLPQHMDMFEMMKYGIEKAGGTDPTKITSALENDVTNKSFLAPTITYTFTPKNHNGFAVGDSALVVAHLEQSTEWPGYHAPING